MTKSPYISKSYQLVLQCCEDIHRPVDCETVAKWMLKNSAESENMTWYDSFFNLPVFGTFALHFPIIFLYPLVVESSCCVFSFWCLENDKWMLEEAAFNWLLCIVYDPVCFPFII